MFFNKTKNVVALISLLFVGTSFAYGMDEKPPYSPRAQQQDAEIPQEERALRPARFHGYSFYGVPIEHAALLSETEKRERLWGGAQIGHGNAMINRMGIAGVDGIEMNKPIRPFMFPVQFSAEWCGAVPAREKSIEDDSSLDVD